MQFTCFRGATFEIAVYSFAPPKPFPKSLKNASQNPLNGPKNTPKPSKMRPKIRQKLIKLQKIINFEKKQKKEARLNDSQAFEWLFVDFWVPFTLQNGAQIHFFLV